MKKLFLLIAAFMLVTSSIFAQDAEKLSGTLSSNLNHYTYDGGYPLTNAVDGNKSTKFWSNTGPNANDYVTMTLPSVSSIGDIKFYFDGGGDKPSAAAVEVSEDNTTWESVATFTSSDLASDNSFSCNAQGTPAQYIRLRFTASQGNWFQLYEFEVYEEPANLPARTISVSVADATMGSAYIGTEGTTSVEGQTGAVKVTAVPATGYTFVNWTLEGVEVSTSVNFVDRTEGDKEYVANFRALEVYNVSVSVNDDMMGSATSSAEGQVYEGTEITLTATPAEGYKFVNWTLDGTVLSDDETFVTTVLADAEYKANFKIKPNKLAIESVNVNLTAWGDYVQDHIIDGNYSTYFDSGESQVAGTTVTVTLAEESLVDEIKLYFTSYSSYRPKKAKIQVSTDNATWTDLEGSEFAGADAVNDTESGKYLIEINANNVMVKYVRMYVLDPGSYLQMAEFEVYEGIIEVPARTISVSVNDADMGSAWVGKEGTTTLSGQTSAVKMIAVAKEGYEFVNWTLNGEVVSTSAKFDDRTEGDKEYVANFVALPTYTVNVSANDAIMGAVEASKTGEMFKYTEITLTATPKEGYEFVNWTLNGEVVSDELSFEVSIEDNSDFVANFRMPLTKIAIERAEATMPHFGSYTADNMIDGNYTSYYDTNDRQYSISGDITVTMVLAEELAIGEAKIYFSGKFRPTAAKMQVSTDYETWTDVENSEFLGEDAVDENDCKLIKIPFNGEVAKYVRMFITEKASTYLTISEFELYEAPVKVAPRQINVSVNDASMGSVYVGTESVTSLSNQTGAVKIVATATEHAYRFVNWTVNGEVVATTPTFIDRTEGDKAYVANFEAKPIYTATATSANTERGTVELTASEVIYEGDEVTFTATPADGYKFLAWTSGTDTISVANPYTVTMTESLSLVANFDRDPKLDRSNWTITASSEETSGEGAGNGIANCIIDGNENSHWHSAWKNSSPAYPHWFMIDMQESKAFDSFEYVSRGAGSSDDSNNNGNIVNYALYTSETEIDPNALENATLVKEGQFTYDGVNKVHKVEFNSVKGRYVMLYATGQSANGGKHASCVEFYLYSNAFAVAVSSSNPEIGTAYIGQPGVTSVGCSVDGTDVVTLTAAPAPKYQFVNWTLNGEVVSTEAVYTTTAVTESRSYVANFEFAPVAPRTIKVKSNNNQKGYAVFVNPTPEGTSPDVTSTGIVTVKAIAQTADDFFVNWTIDGVVVGTEETYEYTEAEGATIQANFISKYVVTVNQVQGGTISVKVGGTTIASGDRVLEGNYIAMLVTENNRSELKKLFVNGEDVFLQYKYNPDYCVKVTGPVTVTAEYGEPVCIVTWENIGNGYVEVWEYDNYDEDADEAGELECPLQPDGAQYAYGAELPFLGTAAIFAYPMGEDTLESLTINGEEIDLEEEWFPYEDYFIDEVESKLHIVATFSGEGSGIEDAEADAASVYAVAGGIVVETAETANVSIYSIAGVLVSEQTVSAKTTIAMEQGVYIVKVADKVEKVVVK